MLPQREVSFCSSPLAPPSRARVKLVTGASGTVWKVVRMRETFSPWTFSATVSTLPSRVDVDLAV